MRKLIRSMSQLSWASSLFGLRQCARWLASGGVVPPRDFATVTAAAAAELDDPIRSLFQVGVNVQNGAMDALFAPEKGVRSSDGPVSSYGAEYSEQPNCGRLNTSSFIALGEGL